MDNIIIVADYCRRMLSLKEARLSDSYFYNSLTLCIIDAVFSIRAKYETTMNTVQRYCGYFNLVKYRTSRKSLPEIYEQQSVRDMIQSLRLKGTEYFADEVFNNRQRTSSKNGILKSEAVLRFASVLEYYNVHYFQDIHKISLNKQFEDEIKDIPGQRSGISLKYFFMLAGSDDPIKPDMHIINFLGKVFREKGIYRNISLEDAQVLLSGASDILRVEYPLLTPRLLDNIIWSYQRKQKVPHPVDKEVAQVIQGVQPTKRMPHKGDIFKGRINDLVQDDAYGWRRRDISFYKNDINFNRRFGYPSLGDRIVLKDTEGHQYGLNFSKPDYDHTICLGTPGNLKSWYQRKGFEEQRIDPDTWIYFQYTGGENEFIIFTENEYEPFLKQINENLNMLAESNLTIHNKRKADDDHTKKGVSFKPHQGDIHLTCSFEEIWNYINNVGSIKLTTSSNKTFEARVGFTKGKPVIKFYQNKIEYARSYKCCWGHYYNCYGARFGMYATTLDNYYQGL